MPYLTLVMSCDTVEDPGVLRFRVGGLSSTQIKSSGPVHYLFERAKVTEFLGTHTVWLRVENLGSEKAPSLIGISNEPATEIILPFFNQFEDWGYSMVGSGPQFTTGSAAGIQGSSWSCTWMFQKPNRPDTPTSYSSSPGIVKKIKIPSPDY